MGGGGQQQQQIVQRASGGHGLLIHRRRDLSDPAVMSLARDLVGLGASRVPYPHANLGNPGGQVKGLASGHCHRCFGCGSHPMEDDCAAVGEGPSLNVTNGTSALGCTTRGESLILSRHFSAHGSTCNIWPFNVLGAICPDSRAPVLPPARGTICASSPVKPLPYSVRDGARAAFR